MSTRRSLRSFQSVLCPVDFSTHSQLALKYAESLLGQDRSDSCSLTVIYVTDPLLVAAAGAAHAGGDLLPSKTMAELRKFVNASLSPGSTKPFRVRCVVTKGDPAREIVAAAVRRNTDLIVIATQGLGGIGRWLVGSTTRNVLAKATVPVLVVPPVQRAPRTRARTRSVVVVSRIAN